MAAPKPNLEKEQIFVMAEKEMEYRVELFNKRKTKHLREGSLDSLRFAYELGGFGLKPNCHAYDNGLGPWFSTNYQVPKRLTHTCFDKCIEKRYKESELNMGENSCIDRCVSKYYQVTNLVGQLLGSNRPPM